MCEGGFSAHVVPVLLSQLPEVLASLTRARTLFVLWTVTYVMYVCLYVCVGRAPAAAWVDQFGSQIEFVCQCVLPSHSCWMNDALSDSRKNGCAGTGCSSTQVAVTVRRKVSPFHRFARPMRAGEAQSLFDELTANSCERNFKSCVNQLAVRLAALEVVLGRLEH